MREPELWVSVDNVVSHLGIANGTIYRWIASITPGGRRQAVAAGEAGRG